MSKQTQTSERRELREDKNFFITAMKRQAGTLAKAALEGIMNSVDAFFKMQADPAIGLPENPRIDVTLTPTELIISDNGMGFQNREEILAIWEVFGVSHEEDEKGFARDTVFGKFRMGRGQLFAFGKNTWRSRGCQMVTDLDNWGREYELTCGMDDQPGCVVTVRLYNTLSLREAQNCVDDIIHKAKYISYDLFINGKKVNIPPATKRWDIETDLVYIDKRNSAGRSAYGAGIELYQQGVYVQHFPPSKFGLVGTVVTKAEIGLNYARNEVMENCPAWREIRKYLKVEGISDAVRSKRMNVSAARNFVEEFSSGEGVVSFEDFFNAACLPDVTGKLWSGASIKALINSQAKVPKICRDPDGYILVDIAPRKDALAEKVMLNRAVLVLDEVVVEYLRCEHHEGKRAQVEAILRTISGADQIESSYAGSFRAAYDRFNGKLRWADHTEMLLDKEDLDYHRLSPDEHTMRERQFLRCAQDIVRVLDYREHGWNDRDNRQLCIGVSAISDIWTNGVGYICINRNYIAGLRLGIERDWHALALRILEMLCCKMDTTGGNAGFDGVDFLSDFHRRSEECPEAARTASQNWRKIVNASAGGLTKEMRDQVNAEAHATAAELVSWHTEATAAVGNN